MFRFASSFSSHLLKKVLGGMTIPGQCRRLSDYSVLEEQFLLSVSIVSYINCLGW